MRAAARLLKAAIEAKGIRVLLRAHDRAPSKAAGVCRARRAAGRPHFPRRPRRDGCRRQPRDGAGGDRRPDHRPRHQGRRQARDQLGRGVYAIGECAEHRGSCYGLVEPVYEQARVLARHLAGRPARYEGSLLATSLKVSGVPVFSMGDFEGEGAETIVLEDEGAGSYRKLVVRDDRLAGVVLFGDTGDALWYRDLIRQSSASIAAIRARCVRQGARGGRIDHERAGLHRGAAPLSRRLRRRACRRAAPRRASSRWAREGGAGVRARRPRQARISPPWPASRRPARSSRPRRRPSATSIPSMPTRGSRPRAPRASFPRASTTSAGASTACSTWRRRRTPTCAGCASPTASSRTGSSRASPTSPRRYGGGYAHVTTRANLQIREIDAR